MKRKVLTGIIVILVLLLGSCDLFEKASEEVEYTDVEYSIGEDGRTNITLYLDGVGVPRTAAQRALSLDLAKMSHDFFEVVFSSSATVARASWELGQSAGIRGVYRPTAGENYTAFTSASATDTTGPFACIFVGRKSDKTLLGIGKMTEVDRVAHAAGNLLLPTSKSVTFEVVAFTTAVKHATLGLGITGTGITTTLYKNTTLGGTQYPLFTLPEPGSVIGAGPATVPDTGATYTATYNINGWVSNAHAAHPYAATTARIAYAPTLIKREPRFLDKGVFWYAGPIDQYTTADLSAAYKTASAVDGFITLPVSITMETKGLSYGVFSIVFQLPVYNNIKSPSTNGGPNHEIWYIRPGFGTSLYNLDDGENAGGCVLLGVGVTALDWLEIYVKGIGLD